MKNKNLSKNNIKDELKKPRKKMIDKKAGTERLTGKIGILKPKDKTVG